MTAGRVVFLPSSGDNIIQAGKGMPATIIQPQGTVQYVRYKSQQPGSSNIPSQQVGPLQKLFRVETKTLGAIQIIIGLMHIGFGGVPVYLFQPNYQPLAAVRGYPFWGGLFFIFSGSLSVAVEKHLNPFLVKCSVGTNIASAILALAGIILCILELHFNQQTYHEINQKNLLYYSNSEVFSSWSVGAGLCVLFLLFSLLEFFIAVFTAYFGYGAACCNYDTALQIMIGLIHIGFGIVSVILRIGYFAIGESILIYPVYSGLSFIASGSVSVSAEKHWNTSLTNTSVGMNIMSALLASLGIVMYICEMAVRLVILKYDETSAPPISVSVAFSALFLLFISLEFCITLTVAHFGCRANCCTDDTAIVYVPCTVSGENIVPAEDNLASQTIV